MNQSLFLNAKDYRQFLKFWIESRKTKVNFSALSRKAGFSSRSFIQEVLSGKRSLTNQSLPRFIKAFDLTGKERRYFECLVALQEPNVELGFSNRTQIENEIQSIRKKYQKSKNQPAEAVHKNAVENWAFKIRHVGEVYAALGDLQSGATIDEIKSRTGLSESLCIEVVKYLCLQSAAQKKGSRYLALEGNFDLFGLGEHEGFKRQYQDALDWLQKRTRSSLQSPEEFFFHSDFSVDRSRMPEFKKKIERPCD